MDKLNVNRKEEDLLLKDSVYKLRRTRLPLLASFLLMSDIIPAHPPLLDYLPAVLTPAQESYIKRRKAQVLDAVDKEYSAFLEERAMSITETLELRKAVAEKTRKKAERDAQAQMDTQMDVEDAEKKPDEPPKSAGVDVEMDTEDADGDRDSATLDEHEGDGRRDEEGERGTASHARGRR
ncbi:hypothetical protein K438DRAFT_1965036 [Mycena galopus ATCC 62051]|nr:hypothetical protein K438DRAFT_1965036 [Mycena galopus ATCC 62051]